jgi:hypothetical protein
LAVDGYGILVHSEHDSGSVCCVGGGETQARSRRRFPHSALALQVKGNQVSPVSDSTQRLIAALETGGLLLLQDKSFPSAVGLITGESLAGSWWSHPRGDEIFEAVGMIAAHPDVLACKLYGGKVTFVHRTLWPAVLAVGQAGEPWQTASLSSEARSLLERIEREGSVTTSGKAAKEIESRLLAHGEQIHTEVGNHKIRLEPWSAWASRAGCTTTISTDRGRGRLVAAVVALGGTTKSLPWHAFESRPPLER